MRLRGGDMEEKREVLADFTMVLGDLQFAVFAERVVHEKLAVERLLADDARIFSASR